MSARRHPAVEDHLLRVSILRTVASSRRPMRGSDLVKMFAKSAAKPPSIKDVRHAVRWLANTGLIEWQKSTDGPGKELHCTHKGRQAARLGLLKLSQRQREEAQLTIPAWSTSTQRVGNAPRAVDGEHVAVRRLPSLVRNADAYVRFWPC